MFHSSVKICLGKLFKQFLLSKIMEEIDNFEEDSAVSDTVDEFDLDSDDEH